MADGRFETMLGIFWFYNVDGIIFAMVGNAMQGERIEVSYATPSFDRWLGEYSIYDANGELLQTITIGVNEHGLAYADMGAIFLMDRVDDYTFFFPGRIRMFGSVAEFAMDSDVATFRYGHHVFTRAPEEVEMIVSEFIGTFLRFEIGNTEYDHDGTLRRMETAPFIDADYGRTMIPLRVIAEVFGAEVNWLPDARIATISLGDINLELSADQPLPGGMGMAHNINGSIFVPLAYVAYALDLNVRWDAANQAIYAIGN
jgi:hypothetical protein